jgi:hypothetical protein
VIYTGRPLSKSNANRRRGADIAEDAINLAALHFFTVHCFTVHCFTVHCFTVHCFAVPRRRSRRRHWWPQEICGRA